MDFIEKYRPSQLDDVVGNVDVIDDLKQIKNKPPHLLFEGKQGTGKTTVAFALCRQVLGENWQLNTLVLNSSMERGIDVIRGKVRKFAATRSLGADFKIVILDECDGITSDGQHALRGTMEEYANNVSFILTCNKPHQLIEPLRSRCKEYHFSPISVDQTMKLIAKIAGEEMIHVETDVARKLAEICNGDMRKVLHDLEMFEKRGRKITMDDLNLIPDSELDELAKTILDGDFRNGKTAIFKSLKNGLTADNILNNIFDVIVNNEFPAKFKLNVLVAIAETERNMRLGTSPDIQLIGLLSRITAWRMAQGASK